MLYGLDRAKEAIRTAGTAVIVEGYMDVIAAHQYGFRNVVASMGTALTERQAALLQRFAERVVLAMDADEAGSAANLRAIQVVAAAAARPHARRPAAPANARYPRRSRCRGQGPGRADPQSTPTPGRAPSTPRGRSSTTYRASSAQDCDLR